MKLWKRRYVILGLSVLLIGCEDKVFKVKSNIVGMEPTIKKGDSITLQPLKEAADIKMFQRWNIIAFRSLNPDYKELILRRIIGMPGEKLGILNNVILLNGRPLTIPTVLKKFYINQRIFVPDGKPESYMDWRKPFCDLPNDTFFVMGDNLEQGTDSRFWGPIPLSKVVGKVIEINGQKMP